MTDYQQGRDGMSAAAKYENKRYFWKADMGIGVAQIRFAEN